jgi:hypothetical protein
MAQSLSNIQVLANAGSAFQIPNFAGDIGKFGKLLDSPRKKLLLFIVTTIAGFAITGVNYAAKGPVIPLRGSGTLVPHTSLTVPVSGLFCEEFILSRRGWDNSRAATSWNAQVYIVPETPPYYDQYEFVIANENVTLSAANRWYMRYAHLHPGSEFALNSCIRDGTQTPVKVCVLRGEGSFKEWTSDLYNCKGSHMYGPYELSSCTSENETSSSAVEHHFVVEDDTYYFVHYTAANSSEVQNLEMNVSISSLDFDYSEFYSSCTTRDYNSCNISKLPLGLRGLAIITAVVERPMGNDMWSYEDNIRVSWKCKGSFRGYILIFCIPIMSVIGCCNLCSLCLALNNYFRCCNHVQGRLQDRRLRPSVGVAGHSLYGSISFLSKRS